jgi:hypothetical protein
MDDGQGMDEQGMDDQGTEPEHVSPHAHAAALRVLIIEDVTAAITSAVARYSAGRPSQPWVIDQRPGAANLPTLVDTVLDEVLETVVVRRIEGVVVSFPSRLALEGVRGRTNG